MNYKFIKKIINLRYRKILTDTQNYISRNLKKSAALNM